MMKPRNYNFRIPPAIEEYFFFDGERLDDYFNQTTGEKLRRQYSNFAIRAL